ncbi:hypothetical protein ACJ73_01456 [Blastomyces percursus]|uniref:BTB domain-containing protein n=1 Tax=Blastomyces percursus TaxID=1658174 RepID=A0A1J9RGN0_9EURO|nr:hypothetical protein ACJ73_01456 [Blastomyces percursus]
MHVGRTLESSNLSSIIRSSPYEFLVGADRTRMVIHDSIAQNLSEPLSALIHNGQMKESISGGGPLDDVDVDTFTGFCEFAYTGVYSRREP